MTDYTEDYLAFYNSYPRKEGKQDGQKAWNGLPAGAKAAALADVEKRKRLGAYSSNKKLIQLPGSYLRAARWEDDWETTLESSRKGGDDRPNTGAVTYTPIDDGLDLTKWESLANRWFLKWLWHGHGLPDDLLEICISVKNTAVAEMSVALDEDLARDKSREAQTSAIETFLGVLLDRLDAEVGRNIKPLLLKGAS